MRSSNAAFVPPSATIANRAPSAVSNRKSASRDASSGPWQLKQCPARIGRMSRLKEIVASSAVSSDGKQSTSSRPPHRIVAAEACKRLVPMARRSPSGCFCFAREVPDTRVPDRKSRCIVGGRNVKPVLIARGFNSLLLKRYRRMWARPVPVWCVFLPP